MNDFNFAITKELYLKAIAERSEELKVPLNNLEDIVNSIDWVTREDEAKELADDVTNLFNHLSELNRGRRLIETKAEKVEDLVKFTPGWAQFLVLDSFNKLLADEVKRFLEHEEN